MAPADLKNVTTDDRVRLYDSLMAYGGIYEYEGAGHVVFNIDISWNQNWTGQSQNRFVELAGDHLDITVGPQAGISGDMIKPVLSWTRVQPSPQK